jgi:hypothetical protein
MFRRSTLHPDTVRPRRVRRLVTMTVAAVLTGSIALAAAPARAADGDDETRRPAVPGSVYDKPFLFRVGEKVSLGGYMDMEFIANENASTFTAHRFVPFIYAQVSDRVSVASEIEFEYGGFVHGANQTDGEIKIEFAHIDFQMQEWLNFRGGLILSPLGRFNLVHDSPTNDLTERPLVDQQIMPVTLFEAGMGFFGTTYPGESSVFTYEAYLVNGFNEKILNRDAEGDANGRVRIRNGRGSARTDNNNGRAFVGRLGFSPMLGLDFGASTHVGRYTNAANPSGNLTIAALDATYSRGRFEFLGEYGLSSIDIPEEIAAEGAALDVNQAGFYAQANYHFLQGAFASLPNCTFTGVVRFDQVDFDTDVDGDRDRRLALGVNFRPTEDTVFKFDLTRRWNAARGTDTDGTGFDTAHFSVATYF